MAIDVAARRRIVIDEDSGEASVTTSVGGESGVEPAYGTKSDSNGGNCAPLPSGIAKSKLSAKLRCTSGGAASSTRVDGGAQFAWKMDTDSDDMYRGVGWERTYGFGYASEVVAQKVNSGAYMNELHRPSAAWDPDSGMFCVAFQKRTNPGSPARYSVVTRWRDRGSSTWTEVQVYDDAEGDAFPQLVRRPDGRLLMYAIRPSPGGGYILVSSFSTDFGKTWNPLSQMVMSNVIPGSVDSVDVAYANGCMHITIGSVGIAIWWLYSIDGGITFRAVNFVVGIPAYRCPRVISLIDETLLLFYVTENAGFDSIRCMRVASGFDSIVALDVDYTLIVTSTTGSVVDLIPFRGYDGLPYVAVCDGTGAQPVYKVYRGSMDGVIWTAENTSPGMFAPWALGPANVEVMPGDVAMLAAEGTFALVWCNSGTSSAPLTVSSPGGFAYESYSVNMTWAQGWENVTVAWDWDWSWSMALGDPAAVSDGMSRSGSCVVNLLSSPTRLQLVGSNPTINWTTPTTPTAQYRNATQTAVAYCAFRVDAGQGNQNTQEIHVQVVGSDAVQSSGMDMRIDSVGYSLYDENGGPAFLSNVAWDFTKLTEVLIAVASPAGVHPVGQFRYSVRLRYWGSIDRAWKVLVGTHVPNPAGTSLVGKVSWGSQAALLFGRSYEIMFGAWTLSQDSSTWGGGQDSLFATGEKAVNRSHVVGSLPIYMYDGTFVAFGGDVAAYGDEWGVQTRYQYGASSLPPGRRGVWMTEDDGVEHHVTFDHGSKASVGKWDVAAMWGTNFVNAKLRLSSSSSFSTYEEYDLTSVLGLFKSSGADVPSGSTTTTTLNVAGVSWGVDEWVDAYFRWESGPNAGKVGIVRSNGADFLVVETGSGWLSIGASNQSFVLFSDRMFLVLPSPIVPRRYVRWVVPAQKVWGGRYRASGVMRGLGRRFYSNWEWEGEDRRDALVETVESPGGQRYVYELGPGRREIDVEFTGLQGASSRSLLGLWRAGRGGRVVCGLVLDSAGDPTSFVPVRIVGNHASTTRALFVEKVIGEPPVLQLVDVGKLTMSEELK